MFIVCVVHGLVLLALQVSDLAGIHGSCAHQLQQ